MTPTPRLIRLMVYTSPLWLLAGVLPLGFLFPVLTLTVLTALLLWDVRGVARQHHFEVSRTVPKRFSFRDEHQISLTVTYRGSYSCPCELRDHLPHQLESLDSLPAVTFQAGTSATMSYAVFAMNRGAGTTGPLHLRAEGPLGLVYHNIQCPAASDIRVYPTYSGMDRHDLAARLDEMREGRRRALKTPTRGTQFESLRQYMPGEDLRNVDWKISAKRGFMISRNFEIEKGQQVALLVDTGRAMHEQIGDRPRLEHALSAALMLGHVAASRGDTVTLAAFSNRIDTYMPPVKGDAVVPSLLEHTFKLQADKVESDYWSVMAQTLARLKRRSLVIMFTDVIDAPGSTGLIRNLSRMASKHLVICIAFVEKALVEMAEQMPQNADQAWLKATAAHTVNERTLALEQMRAYGIMILETEPQHLSTKLIADYLRIKQRGLL